MTESASRVSIGVNGLDEVLYGGLVRGRAYLVRGGPGCGKTTIGLHFLTTGVRQGEPALFISLGETEKQLRENAHISGFNVDGITFLDLSPTMESFAKIDSYDIFSPAEVEREPTTRKIIETVEKLQPTRVFVDSMTQFRYLSSDAYQYRKQILSFVRFIVDHGATIMFTSEHSHDVSDDDLKFLSDGIIELEMTATGRTLNVTKFRGSDFRSGIHSMRLSSHGMDVFPQLLPDQQLRSSHGEPMSSGVPELDELLHGGLERGSLTLISGPSGSGKTTLGLQFMKEAAGRGIRSVVYLFEEFVYTVNNRCEAINIPVRSMIEGGKLALSHIEPLKYTPDEFARLIRRETEERGASIVMIDSIAGYGVSMQGRDLHYHLHALCKYLKSKGMSVILINELEQITGNFRAAEGGISYLADNIIFLRYIECAGQLRKAIGVLKKRSGDFEKSLRELEITRYGLKVGPPLSGLRGILSGVPEFLPPTND